MLGLSTCQTSVVVVHLSVHVRLLLVTYSTPVSPLLEVYTYAQSPSKFADNLDKNMVDGCGCMSVKYNLLHVSYELF